MTDSPDRGREEQWRRGGRDDQAGRADGHWGPGSAGPYSDPAYASQAPYGPPYQPPPPRPTERLPMYSPYGSDPYATGQYPPPYPQGSEPPPEEPRSPRWLWIVAGVAVVTIIGLVIALVIVNSSSQQTVMAPIPAQPEPSSTTPTRTPTTTSRSPRPSTPVLPLPTAPSTSPSTGTTVPGATDTVVYEVGGTGRAINITYVDTGGLLQTEFNVTLPWTKEVSLPQPGENSASISIINVGRDVSCSISINGVKLDQRIGSGLTICTPTG